MFTWICPKCGKEVAPSYQECPNCAAQSQPAPAEAPSAPRAERTEPARRPPQRRPVMPGWALSILVALLILALGAGAFYLFRPGRATPPAAPAAESSAPFETPAAPAAPAPAVDNPAFKNIELTGLRLTEDGKQKAQLQFVVVNHSAADLGEIAAKVNLRAGSGAKDQAPFATFSFKTNLGPYEAKDLKVPVDTKLRVYELPDWQFLRAEIEGR